LDNKLDRVQLRIIENYGTVNRDLDKLLLISAESEDVDEKVIALKHMMERIEVFGESYSFSSCMEAVISAQDPKHRMVLVNLLPKNFSTLPPGIIDKSMLLLVDPEKEVRNRYWEIYSDRIEIIDKLETNPEFKLGRLVKKIQLIELLNRHLNNKSIEIKVINRFLQITLPEFKIVFKNNLELGYDLTQYAYSSGGILRRSLSNTQKENIKYIEEYIITNLHDDRFLQKRSARLVVNALERARMNKTRATMKK